MIGSSKEVIAATHYRLLIVVIGNLQEHFGQGAGLFTDVHHADNHRRKYARGLERRRNSLAFFDALVDGANGVADNDVAGRFLTMVRACRIGTPLLMSVPSVRVKREIATLFTTGPTTGILSLNLSQTCRPNFVS